MASQHTTRIPHCVQNIKSDLKEMFVGTDKSCPSDLTVTNLSIPSGRILWQFLKEEPLLREALQTKSESVTETPLEES